MNTLAVDFGGTIIKAGRVEAGRITARAQMDGRSELGVDQALPRLAHMLRELRTTDVDGLAIALPTLVDARTSQVLATMKGKYEGLHERDLVEWSRRELGLPLRVENDVHAAILGEWHFGSGRGCDDLVMATLGTGLGTSVIVRGKALRGRHSSAGNLGGHFVVDPHGFPCVCGGRGCVEAQQHLHAVQALAIADPLWAQSKLVGEASFDYAALFRHADTDRLARKLLDRSLDLWGAVAVSLIHQFDCERFILGGGVMRSAALILPHVQRFADTACTPWGRVTVVAAELGDDAALLGLHSMFEKPPEYL